MTVTCALSPIAVAMTENVTAVPTTPTASRRMHNPYLRAPTPAATAVTTVTTTPAAVALLPLPTSASPSYQQQPQSQQQMFLPVVKPVMTPMAHPMRPQQQLFQQQQQQSQAASCVYGMESNSMMGTPAASMMMMPASMMASSVVSALPAFGAVTCAAPAPAAGMMVAPAAVQQQQLSQSTTANNNVVNVISHKDLSGSALRYVRFTALDGTSAAAPRRDRTTGPYQAPAMPPVINEALMASPEAANLVDVFVSQLPFDLPLQALRALADAVVPGAPIRIAHAAPHQRRNGGYDGCCFVKMPEPDAHRFIAALHKRVLFDVFGLWVAGDQAGLEEMTAYCAHMQSLRPDARRRILCRPTPFSAVTAELAKRVYAF